MSAHANPDIVTNGLVFGFDTGYPLVSESHETYRYNRGEPTTTFDVGTMVPTNPNTYFTSNATSHNNLNGTVWDWSYYPNSNISSDGGMEWVPNYRGPGFTGAWKMKKRAGGNSESNFSGTAPGSIDSSKTYTVSVWCKTDQASMARIHLNTTRSGSSYWGYASSSHSGGGGWERLTVSTTASNVGSTIKAGLSFGSNSAIYTVYADEAILTSGPSASPLGYETIVFDWDEEGDNLVFKSQPPPH